MSEGLSPEELHAAVNSIVADLLRVPQDQKLKRLKERLLALRPEIRGPAETLVLQTETIMTDQHKTQAWEKIAIVIFGVLFVTVLLVIAIFIPRPTPFQFFIFRVVLALAAAGVAAIIPGFFRIESRTNETFIRAGGALAVFVLIYLLNPPQFLIGR